MSPRVENPFCTSKDQIITVSVYVCVKLYLRGIRVSGSLTANFVVQLLTRLLLTIVSNIHMYTVYEFVICMLYIL